MSEETFSMQPFRDKLEHIKSTINTVPYEARSDLMIMWKHCESLIDLMSKESVECRRLHKKTSKFRELEKNTTESIENLEIYITMGLLSF
jgi:hypothetical protein